MKITPTSSGGRIAEGKTPYGDYRVEWDRDGNLLHEHIEIRTPETERVSWTEAAARLTHGATGIAKSALGIDPAPEDVVKARLEVCGQCEHLTEKRRCGKLLTKGKTCGCWVDKKTKIAGEKCPLGKW